MVDIKAPENLVRGPNAKNPEYIKDVLKDVQDYAQVEQNFRRAAEDNQKRSGHYYSQTWGELLESVEKSIKKRGDVSWAVAMRVKDEIASKLPRR